MISQTESTPLLSASRWLDLTPQTIVRTAWRGRGRVLSMAGLFAALGVVVALLRTPEFVSEARIMPEMSTGSGDMVKRLASVAGFTGMDFPDAEGVDALRPDLYPTILQSTPFILYLIDQSATTTDGQQTIIGRFLLPNDGVVWSLKRPFSFESAEPKRPTTGKAGGPVQLSARQNDLAEDISKRVSAKLDTRSGVITITAKMPDANVAARVAQLAMDYLTQYVTSYRTEKARQDLHFYGQRLNEARRRYQTAQYRVFRYNDGHKHLVVQAATMDKQRMEAELTIAQTVYTELSRQFEQAKLKVQERTPVFKVLEPAQVPLKRVSPKRILMVLVFTVAGLVISVLYLLAQQADWLGRLRAMVGESSA